MLFFDTYFKTAVCIVIVTAFYSLSLGTAKRRFNLRVKVSSAHLPTTDGGGFTLSLFIAGRQVGELRILIFTVFGLTRPGIQPWSIVSVADAPSTRSLTWVAVFVVVSVV